MLSLMPWLLQNRSSYDCRMINAYSLVMRSMPGTASGEEEAGTRSDGDREFLSGSTPAQFAQDRLYGSPILPWPADIVCPKYGALPRRWLRTFSRYNCVLLNRKE